MFGQNDNQQHSDGQDWQQPQDQSQVVQPATDNGGYQDVSAAMPAEQVPQPVAEQTVPAPSDWAQPTASAPAAPLPVADPITPPATVPSEDAGDLLDIKQKALEELSPLVGHLGQTPEEKFKTTMMMIQASDNQALIPEAYTAAQAITDEKVKAQALLDIVNEINYFTQHAA